MPIKQVSCSICSSTVNKSQTFALPNGTRACRSHPEAQAAGDASRKAQINHVKTAEQRLKAKREEMFPQQPIKPLVPTCFCCRREGLRQDEFFTRLLIANAKLELQGEKISLLMTSPEEGAKLREAMKESPDDGDYVNTCLWIIEAKKFPQLNQNLHRDARTAVQMTGAALVCPQCCKRLNIEPMQKSKEMTFEQLQAWSLVVDDVLKPKINEIAAAEMEKAK